MSADQPTAEILEAQLNQSIAILLEQSKRSQADIKKLEEMTLEVPFFKEYRKEGKEFIHRRCCALMGYQYFNPGEAVFHIDTQGDKFYIILKGTAGVYIRIDKTNQPQSSQSNQSNNSSDPKKEQSNSNPNQQVVSSGNNSSAANANQDTITNKKPSDLVCVKELHEGQSFGELALLQNKKRLASIICHSACHVATLDKASFHQVLGESEEQKILKEMQFFADLPFFEGWNFNLLKLLYLNSYQKNFSKGQFVFKENTDPNAVYFIKSGEFEVFKTFTLSNVKNAVEEEDNEQDSDEYSNWVSVKTRKVNKMKNNEEQFDSSNVLFGQKGKYSKGKKKDEQNKEDKKEKRPTKGGNKQAEQNDKNSMDKNESQQTAADNDQQFSQSDHTRQLSQSSQSSQIPSLNKRLRFSNNGKPTSENTSETIGDRKEVKLCIYTSKELFGEEDIMGQSKRSFGVRCISMTGELIMVKSKDFQNRMMSELRTRQLIKQRCSFKKEQMNQKLSMLHKSLSNYSNYFFAATQMSNGNVDGGNCSPQEENRNPLLLKSLKQHQSKGKINQGQGVQLQQSQQQLNLNKDIQSSALLVSEKSLDSPHKLNRPQTQIFIRSSRNLKASSQNNNIDQNASMISNNRNNNNFFTQPQQQSYASALNDSHTFINSPTLTHQKSQGLFQSSRGLQLQPSKSQLAINSQQYPSHILGGIDSPIGIANNNSMHKNNNNNNNNNNTNQVSLGNRNILLRRSSVEEQENFLSPSLLSSDTPLLLASQAQQQFTPQLLLNHGDLNNSGSSNNNNTPLSQQSSNSASQPYFRSLKSRLRLSRQNNNEEQVELSLFNNHNDNLPSQQLAQESKMLSIKLIEYPKSDNKDTIAATELNRDNNFNNPNGNNNNNNNNIYEQLKNKQQQTQSHQVHKSPRQNTPPQSPDPSKLIFPTSCKSKEMPVYQNEMTVSFYRNLRLNYQLKFANSNVQNLKKHIQSSLISRIPDNFEAIDYQSDTNKSMPNKACSSQQILAGNSSNISVKRNKNRLSCIEPQAKKELGGASTETSRLNEGQLNNQQQNHENNNSIDKLHQKRNTIQARFSSFLVEQRKQHLIQQTLQSSSSASGYLLPLKPSSSQHLAESINLDQKKPTKSFKDTRISFTLPDEAKNDIQEDFNNQHDSIVETNENQNNNNIINTNNTDGDSQQQLKHYSSFHNKWLSPGNQNNNSNRQPSSSPVVKPRQQYSRFNYNAGTSIRLDMPLLESLSTSESAIILNHHGSPVAAGNNCCSPQGIRLSTNGTCGSLTEKQLLLISQKPEDSSKSSIRNIFEKHYLEKQTLHNDTYTQRVLQKSANNKHRPYFGMLNSSSNNNSGVTHMQLQQQPSSESKNDGIIGGEPNKDKQNNNSLLRSSFDSVNTKANSKVLIREKKPAVFRASWDNKSLFQISQKDIQINEGQQQQVNKQSSPASVFVSATNKDQQQQYQPFPLDLNIFKNFKKPSDRKVISKFEKSLLLPKNTINHTSSNINTFPSS